MRRTLFLFCTGLLLLAPFAALAQNFTSPNYQEVSPTITPGGLGTSSSYKLYGSMGEIAHGTSSSASYSFKYLGFFSFAVASKPVVTPTVGNGSGRVDLSWSASIPFLGYQVSGYQIGRSTTSGGPYSYTAVGNVLTSIVTGLTNGTTYYFIVRATDPSSIPIATSTEVSAVPIAPSLTFTIDSGAQSLPTITPGALAATSSILQVNTANVTGFNVTLARSNTTGTLQLASDPSTVISDKTDWTAPSATTTSGPATASTTQPQTLQFRLWKAQSDAQVYASTWWGVDDTVVNALFAGIPSTTQTIANSSVAAAATSTARVLYDLSVGITQKTGTYNGNITYTATANP